MAENRRKRGGDFLVQGSILAVTSILVRLIGLIYRIPMTRIIGNEGMGYYEYAFEIYNFCFIIASYGMPMAVSKLIAERISKYEFKNSRRIFRGALLLAVLLGGLLSLAVFFGADFISVAIFSNPAVRIPLKILAPTIFTSSVLGVIRGFFQGFGDMTVTSISQLFEQIVNGAVSVYASYEFTRAHSVSPHIAAHGAAGGVLGTFLGSLAALLIVIFFYTRNMSYLKSLRKKDATKPESRKVIFIVLLSTIIPIMLSQILTRINSILSMTLYNKILIAKAVSETELNILYGIYGSKHILLLNIVLSITSAMSISIIPALVNAKKSGNLKEVNEKVTLALKFNLIIALPSAVGLSILGGPIIRLLFNDEAPVISLMMLIGSISIIFYSLAFFFNTIIQSIDKMRVPVIHNIISIILTVLLTWALLQFTDMKIFALVIGNIFMPFVVAILDMIYIKRRLDIRFNSVKSILIPTIASMIMGIVVAAAYFLINKQTGSYLLALFLSIPLGVLTFFVAELGLKGISKSELSSFPMGGIFIKLATLLRLMK